MEKTKVHNLIIVDASGSMSYIYKQALAGINQTLDTIRSVHKQEADVDQYVTLLSFSGGGEALQYVYRDACIDQTRKVTKNDYTLRGSTALYDAIGDSVSELRGMVGGEDKCLVTIITDGYENDSRKWTGTQVKALIDELRGKGWVFTYIGANQDVEREAQKMGVVNTMRFEATVAGTVQMFERERVYRQRWNERVRRGERNLEEGYFSEEPVNVSPDRVTADRIDRLAPDEVFVFGSNILGHHHGGAAHAAMHRFGAQYGIGEGLQGQSYAIPTVGCPRSETEKAVRRFIIFAMNNPDKRFLVTPIGCGNGGWIPADMARLFADASNLPNISLPRKFWQFLA